MTDVTLTLDNQEFYFAVRGFANGSHLTQDVWETIVFLAMRQMDDEFMNFLWWTLRKNHFEQYMRQDAATSTYKCDSCGADDYMHILAALHLRNRFKVKFVSHNTEIVELREALCYKFCGEFRPLKVIGEKPASGVSFNAFIPDEWIEGSEWIGFDAENEFVERRHADWWEDINIYNNFLY